MAPLTEEFAPSATLARSLPEGWRVRRGRLAGIDCLALATGVGKVNAAALSALAFSAFAPRAALLVGIGGAYPGASLRVGQAALAVSDTHLDTGAGHGAGWSDMQALGFPLLPATDSRPAAVYNRVALAAATAELATALDMPALPFGTAEAVTVGEAAAQLLRSRHAVAIESMEGAAVAQVAAAMAVPLYQVRGVSNLVGDRNKANWRVPEAVAASCSAAARLAPLIPEVA